MAHHYRSITHPGYDRRYSFMEETKVLASYFIIKTRYFTILHD